ncbi:MAG: AraC family transcriptional regulator [Lachnospiraceae bacterium]|nr:AraC family transcriptional regulator [Lachnospiraceae bacterium]
MGKNDESLIGFEEINRLLHDNAEVGFKHTTYREESERFHLLLNGDYRAVDESAKLMTSNMQGTLSKDPLRNAKYLFVVNTGLVTRYLIEGGIPQEKVYATSDLYIQKADMARTIDEINNLNRELWKFCVELVRKHLKSKRYSKAVYLCLDHIDTHFNQKITLKDLSERTGLNSCYLATLFKKETGVSFGNYLTDYRIDVSKALLTKSSYSYSQIAYSLGFCSQSRFTQVFRKRTGLTPKQYRMKIYNNDLFGT